MITLAQRHTVETIVQKINKIEDILYKIQPNIFINFLELPADISEDLLKKYAGYLKSTIDFKNTEFTKHIPFYISQLKSIQPLVFPGQKTTIGGIEEQLLEALRTAQYARFFIEMPLFALYQLEKVYSKPEQEAYGILTPQEQDSVKVTFDVSELIYTHPSGLFDLSKTLEREQKTKELSIFFSTIQSVQYQSDFIIHTLQNNSKHIPFAFARKDITEALSLKAAEIICESFAHEVHKKLAKRINLTNALEETRKEFQKIGTEYTNTGNSSSDSYKLGAKLYSSLTSIFSKFEFKPEDRTSIVQETMRIALLILTKWYNMPDMFFSLSFRSATDDEKMLSPEITHAVDVMEILGNNTLDKTIYESYVFSIPEAIKNYITILATRGIENPKAVKNLIDEIQHPNVLQRVRSKLITVMEQTT